MQRIQTVIQRIRRVACVVAALGVIGSVVAQPPPSLFPTIVVDVPGRSPSTHFAAQVFYNGSWTAVYVFETIGKNNTADTMGYFSHLSGWTASWVSSQLPTDGSELLLRVKRLAGGPIARAAVHPVSSGARIVNISAADGVTVGVSAAARIAIDFDGAMDDTDTGPLYNGPPVHTFCWFVDPTPAAGSLPDPNAPTTVVVRPGDAWPTKLDPSTWPTVVFAPGVHHGPAAANNWTLYSLQPQTRYFLCAGSVVHAAFAAGEGAWGQNGIMVDGYGVLSGEEMTRPANVPNNSPLGVAYRGLTNSSLSGITIVDFPNHHMILGQSTNDVVTNVKVLGWRANGDGLHVFGSWQVSDLFMRVQDDSMYVDSGGGATTTFSGITVWNDANGCAFIFSAGGGSEEAVTLSDSDVIYARASWAWWTGGRIFAQRGSSQGAVMSGVRINNVRVEDTLPSLNAFQIDMTSASGAPVTAASFTDVQFSNISIANFSTMRQDFSGNPLPHGVLNLIFAMSPTVNVSNVAFNNVTIAGLPLQSLIHDVTVFNLSRAGTLINVTVDGVPIY